MNNKEYYQNLFNEYILHSSNNTIDCNSDDLIYLHKSNIHGFGIFAKRDIKPNEILTIYPAHIIQIVSINPYKIKYKLRANEEYKDILPEKWQDYAIWFDKNI